METEKKHLLSGYLSVLIIIVFIAIAIFLMVNANENFVPMIFAAVLILAVVLISKGLIVVNPNESMVLVLFGEYKGTVKRNGFFFVNPFYVRKKITLRARNLNREPIKVNDKLGNPIMIGIVLVWKVEETFKAAFEVDDYSRFVDIQSESATRKLAGHYAYDNFDDEQKEITLRAGGEEVHLALEKELSERLAMAGIKVMEARIS